ncbi:MAG: magnesium transporter [Ardenticatenales bacterium]
MRRHPDDVAGTPSGDAGTSIAGAPAPLTDAARADIAAAVKAAAAAGDMDEAYRMVAAALEARDIETVGASLSALRPADRVDVFENFGLVAQRQIIDELDDDEAAAILDELDDEEAAEVAEGLSSRQLAPILDLMETDEAADLLNDLPPAQMAELLEGMDDAAEAEVRPLLEHMDDTAGGRMTRDFVALSADETVKASIRRLRALEPGEEAAYYLYVRDADERLVGIVSLRQIIVAPPKTRIGDLMHADVIRTHVSDDQEDAAQLMQRYDLLALPVVDDADRLVGVITHDDLVDVLAEEATEDMYRMVGLDVDERSDDGVWTSVRNRLPWLTLNLATQLLLVAVLASFQRTTERVVILSVLFPLVTGNGGNVGAQTTTLVVRSLALGEIDKRQIGRLLFKEVGQGLINGMAIGVLAGLVALVINTFFTAAPVSPLLIGGAVFLAMALNLAAGGLAGVVMPLTLERFGIDPAVSSAVFVTTVTDTMGSLLFFGIFNLLARALH